MKEKRHLVMWVEFIVLAVLLARLEIVRIRENTKALYIETPSNPTMRVTDLRKMKEIADKLGVSDGYQAILDMK